MSKIKTDMEITAKCPFFRDGGGTTILCEGAIRSSSLRQIFTYEQDRKLWARSFCSSMEAYTDCPIYKIAILKYQTDHSQ